MNDHSPFNPLQAQEVAKAFAAAGVGYLFIGKRATRSCSAFPAPRRPSTSFLQRMQTMATASLTLSANSATPGISRPLIAQRH
jgi:hypothetical protein